MKGFVYILSNPSMPGLVKIGMTTRSVEGRANELYQTGVPTPFRIEYRVFAPDCAALEQVMHEGMADLRVGEGREFFRCESSFARDALDAALLEQIEEYVSEFTESYRLCEEPFCVDPGDIYDACTDTELHPYEFACVVRFLDPEAVQSAYERLKAHRARMRDMAGNVVVSF